jgi:hypothetical protein
MPAIDDRSFRRLAGGAAVLSVAFAAANLAAMFVAVRFDFGAISHPLVLLRQGGGAATWWRWSMVFDALGYYLLITPAIVAVWSWLRPRRQSWTDLSILCLLGYVLIGAIGCAILATAIPPLIHGYANAGAQRPVLETVFTAYSNAVYRGMWNLLEEFVAGVGWIGVGFLLLADQRRFGQVTVALGAACLLDSFGTAVNLDAIATIALSVYLVLAPIWACWLGLHLLRYAKDAAVPVKSVIGVMA